jgi:predicted component of type VI protein secretion system
MGLHKGTTNNLNGRPKGGTNGDKDKLRKFVKNFLESNLDQVMKDYKKLEPKDRLKVFTDLLQYGLPKLQSVSNELTFGEQMPKIIITPAPDYEPIKENENGTAN